MNMRALCVVLYFSVLLFSAYGQDCNSNGDLVGAICVCRSGYSGANCELTPTGTCTAAVPQDATTGNFPVLSNVITFTNNELKASVVGPYVRNRKYTSLKPSGTSETTCVFASANPTNFWTRSGSDATVNDVTSCYDNFQLTLPWTSHSDCGFAEDASADPDHVKYISEFVLGYTDELSQTVNGQPLTRETTIPYKIWVSFPTKVTVTLESLSVSSMLEIGAALTSDAYNPTTRQLTLQLTTVTNWPNRLYQDWDLLTPVGKNISFVADSWVVDSTGCSTTQGSVCVQKISFMVEPTSALQCDFDGKYNFSATVATCRDNGGQACASTHTSVITFEITSSDICGDVSVTPIVTGSLKSYHTDSTDGTWLVENEQTKFALGVDSYFHVSLSTGGNDVSLTFTDIYFTGTDGTTTTTRLMQGGVRVPGQTNAIHEHAALVLKNVDDATTNNANSFHIYFAPQVFNLLPFEMNTYTVTAIGTIVFRGNEPTAAPTAAPPAKREVKFVFAADPKKLSTSSQVYIARPDASESQAATATEESNGTISVGAVTGGVVGALALLALIGTISIYIVRKRKQPKQPVPDSAADASTGAAQSPMSTQV